MSFESYYEQENKKIKKKKIISIVALALVIVALFGMLFAFHLKDKKAQQKEYEKELEYIVQQADESEKLDNDLKIVSEKLEKAREKGAFAMLTEAKKFLDGNNDDDIKVDIDSMCSLKIPLNIVIVGDSIGAQGGNDNDTMDTIYGVALKKYLRSTYGLDPKLTNVSLGGNTSVAGAMSIMKLGLDGVNNNLDKYDLVIVVYGQNDNEDKFDMHYEFLLHSINIKFPNASIISVLQSSQRTYTKKILTIQDLCKKYNVPVADTIKPFNVDEETYNSLTQDRINLNHKGMVVYYETIKSVIDSEVKSVLIGKANYKRPDKPFKSEANNLNNFLWLGTGSSGFFSEGKNTNFNNLAFRKIDDKTYAINVDDISVSIPSDAVYCIDYSLHYGDNVVSLFVDGNQVGKLTTPYPHNGTQRHIRLIHENTDLGGTAISANNEIKVVFDTAEHAQNFNGVSVCWK